MPSSTYGGEIQFLGLLVLLGSTLTSATYCDPVNALAAGSSFACGLTYGPGIECWGKNNMGQIEPPATAIAIEPKFVSTGDVQACAIGKDGDIVCWGQPGSNGQTGYDILTPPTGLNFKYVTVGYHFSCAITAVTNEGICWGDDNNDRVSDVAALNSSGVRWNSLSAGTSHGCGVTIEGMVRCWGVNIDYKIYDGDNAVTKGGQCDVPTYYPGGVNYTGWESVCAGGQFSCGLLKNGTIDCWGRGQHGQLDVPGGGSVSTISTTVYKEVQCAKNNACAVRIDGSSICWGYGGRNENDIPSTIRFHALSTWFRHGCGIALNGTTMCWGDDRGFNELDVPTGIQVSLSPKHHPSSNHYPIYFR